MKSTQSIECCMNRFIIREQIIGHLRMQGDLSDSELEYAAKEFPEIIVQNMQPDSRVALAYLKAGNPVGRDTLPEKLWEDKEVVYQAFCNVRSLPTVAIRKLNDEIFERFLNEHTDEELECFIRWQRHLPQMAHTYFDKRGIFERVEKIKKLKMRDNHEGFSELLEDQSHFENETFDEVDFSGDIELIPKGKNSLKTVEAETLDLDTAVYPRVFHYITDLHLTHKVKAKVDKGIPINKAVKQVVTKAVKDIEKSIAQSKDNLNDNYNPHVLLIGGDVSFDIKIAEAFYRTLADSLVIRPGNIYVVMGNHELWDGDPAGKEAHDCEHVIEKYRELLSSFGITLLENQVVAVVSDLYRSEKYILDQRLLEDVDNQSLIELLFAKSRYIICGGVGYSGCNNHFNVKNGIYRNTINSRNEEIQRSAAYENFFQDVKRLAKGKTIISLTHMPREDWLRNNDCNNCIFISGHTHRNYRLEEDTKVYADNQIGYKTNRYNTKQFVVDASYDIFLDYPDGIHKISRIDYSEFGKGIGLYLSFRHDPYSELYLIKRDGVYMFVSKSKNGLSIMNGGQRKKLTKKDLNYYYSNLPRYVSLLISSFGGYEDYLKTISNGIKKVGGSGRIHGCIVDVDFFNHIYVNPYDGKITCYYAESTFDRYIFSDFVEMIESTPSETETILRIRKKYLQGSKPHDLIVQKGGALDRSASGFSVGDYIYQPSRQINKIHKLFNYNVLQFWDDSMM